MSEFGTNAGHVNAAGFPAPYPTDAREVEALIAAATEHPLGIEFLIEGHLEAVAITFQVHVFTVDAARRALCGE